MIEKLEEGGLLNQAGRKFFASESGEKGGPRKVTGEGPRAAQRPSGLGAPRAQAPRPEGGARFRGSRPEGGAQAEGGPRSRGGRPESGARYRSTRPEGGVRPERATNERVTRPPATGKGVRFKPGAPEALVAERLQKVMAAAGVASRRHSEELIQAGRVTINGSVVTELGTKVVPGRDVIEVDGRPLGQPESLIYLLLNKPKGYVTTLYDPQGRPKVTDILGEEVAQRVYPVGRLDYETEGLLLLTNDGELANALMHPARQVKKTYIAKVRGVPGPAKIKALEEGIELDDGPTAPAEVKLIGASGPNSATLSVRIHEGRNRQVRRMFEAVGHEMIHLKRTTLGPLTIKDMDPGQWRELTDREITELKAVAGLKTAPVPRGARVAGTGEERKVRRGTGRKSPAADRTAAVPARYGAGFGPGRDEGEGERKLGAPVPAGGPVSRPMFRPTSRPGIRPESGPDPRPAGRPAGRPESRPVGRPAGRPDARPAGRPDSRPDSGRPSAGAPKGRFGGPKSGGFAGRKAGPTKNRRPR